MRRVLAVFLLVVLAIFPWISARMFTYTWASMARTSARARHRAWYLRTFPGFRALQALAYSFSLSRLSSLQLFRAARTFSAFPGFEIHR